MQPTEDIPHEPPLSSTGHALPRRTSPEKAIALRHHQLARDASLKASRGSVPRNQSSQDSLSPGRASSEESHETGQSDAEEWFNQANQNPTATFDSSAMNVDPPFFQKEKESDSANEDKPYHFQSFTPRNQSKARSSSGDDYRIVIDDLTMEIQKLKEELKHYKQRGPDVLQKDKLFEIKIHGLPRMKKGELEATLRKFMTTLGDTPDASSLQRNKKSWRHGTHAWMYYGTGSKSQSKHASLSSGSHTQPIDSAYASMSTGACSSGTSLNRSQGGSQFKANELRVENYLREIPEGLYPRFISMTNKKKKKLVLRSLEQIRWHGGTDGTKFSSDSSGDLSQWSPETDDTENAKGDHHKRKKTGRSGYNLSRLGPQISASSDSFHYKPLFLHQQSPNEQSSMKDGTLSFFDPTEESNADSSGQSGSGAFNRRKLRRYGTIIYYNGTPFCTDLSGDPEDISPTTYMLSGGRERLVPQVQFVRPMPFRSRSASSMNRRPLSDANLDLGSMSKMDVNDGAGTPELVTESGDESSEFSMEFPWSDAQQILEVHPLEPCGLGGVLPEDHFRVMVTTRRSKIDAYVNQKCGGQYKLPEEATDNITNRLATMSTSSPRPSVHRLLTMDNTSKIKIEYLSGRTQRLEPVPLPPPAIFFPPLSADSWSEDGFGSDGDDELTPSEEFLS